MTERIFISSAQKEFDGERRAIRDYIRGDALLRRFFDVFLFEDLPASDRRTDDVYLDEVSRCDIYVGLFGNEYGYEDSSGMSPTAREFERATATGKVRLCFVKGSDDSRRHPKMRALIGHAAQQLIRRRFADISDLTAALYASLIEYLERTGRLRTRPFDAAACHGATITDISSEKVERFLSLARRIRNYPIEDNVPVVDALTHLNLLDNGQPSNAAVLLFGQKPQRFLTSSEVKCLHFHGTEVQKPIPSYQIYHGTVFELVDQAVDFVMSKIARSVGTRSQGPQVPVEYEIPRDAVAEAIVNAVMHRDYASNASVQVMLFADRLEVWNPGSLPPALTLDQLRLPHASIPRNPLVADPMFLARYAEKAGSGILDMIALSKKAGLATPQFRQDGGEFIQTLWRPKKKAAAQAQVKAHEAHVEAHEAHVELTPTEKAMLQACRQTPKTSPELVKAAGYTTRTGNVKRSLEKLLHAGLLEMTIPDKPRSRQQRYRITAKGRAAMVGKLGDK
jgi:predicted HTH transcriptional regulator